MNKVFFGIFFLAVLLIFGCASTGPTTGKPEAGVGVTSDQPPAPLKHFNTPQEYIGEAKILSDAGRYGEALNYLKEAMNLDYRNQQVHLLAGVAQAKLGKGEEARDEFKTVVRINDKTADAATAQQWLERFQHPLPIMVFPINIESKIDLATESSGSKYHTGHTKRSEAIKSHLDTFARNGYDRSLPAVLTKCGFYQVSLAKKSANPSSACGQARTEGAKIAVVGQKATLTYKEDTNIIRALGSMPVGILAGVLGIPEAKELVTTFSVSIILNIDIYEAGTGKKITSLEKFAEKNKLWGMETDTSLQKLMAEMFDEMALDIHNALL